MLTPTPTLPAPPDQGSPESPSPAVDPARAMELRRQLRGLALALFSWTARPPDMERSTASERLLAATIRPLIPRLRDSLLSRLDSADPAALEAMIGATSDALASMLYYAPGEPLPRYIWRFAADGSVELAPAAPADG